MLQSVEAKLHRLRLLKAATDARTAVDMRELAEVQQRRKLLQLEIRDQAERQQQLKVELAQTKQEQAKLDAKLLFAVHACQVALAGAREAYEHERATAEKEARQRAELRASADVLEAAATQLGA
jgi:hypothetical protein